MNAATALALLSLVVSGFTVLAVGAVYARLRALERGRAGAEDIRHAPAPLLPGSGHVVSLVLLMDAGCPICPRLWRAARAFAADRAEVRLIGLVAGQEAAERLRDPSGETLIADAAMWAELYEGYTPCVYLVGAAGAVTHRHFVYGDTDIPALLARILPEPAVPAIPGGPDGHAR
ncbi:hypothetical protein [Spongiactinospora sp. TRM90649]|uniref:hypothetical protein n=1 Tax=Spongiactinospora sp. TRM90649 TaxID=3031114 RepID=UPI0023F75D13|nr:hypothetical protein [Spongiactinospora sp. TRM90649]MDF5755727.1 hypothetical protein [Spongiactinospora sp. TRM90649]